MISGLSNGLIREGAQRKTKGERWVNLRTTLIQNREETRMLHDIQRKSRGLFNFINPNASIRNLVDFYLDFSPYQTDESIKKAISKYVDELECADSEDPM
jgi:hypothetical protein